MNSLPPSLPLCSRLRVETSLDQFRESQSVRANQGNIHEIPTPPCLVCFENMTQVLASKHQLLLLACGHAVCASCCMKIADTPTSFELQKEFGSVQCPLCRTFGDPVNKSATPEQLDGTSSVMIDEDGTFEVHVKDTGQRLKFVLSCSWETSMSEILDLVAPLRVYEFPDEKSLVFPREKLSLCIEIMGVGMILPGNATLAGIGYHNGYVFEVSESNLTAPHCILKARLERFAKNKVFPKGDFTIRLFDYLFFRGTFLLINVNKSTTLDEIVQRLKEKIRTSDMKDADGYSDKEQTYNIFGKREQGYFNQEITTLGDICCQGYECWRKRDGGVLYYE